MRRFIFFIFILFLPAAAMAGSYESLASKLAAAGQELKGARLAIIPFDVPEGLPEVSGAEAAHKLHIALSKNAYYEIVSEDELRSEEIWLKENRDSEKNYALQLMARLNASIAITGKIIALKNGNAEIKANLVNTGERKIIASILEEIPFRDSDNKEKMEGLAGILEETAGDSLFLLAASEQNKNGSEAAKLCAGTADSSADTGSVCLFADADKANKNPLNYSFFEIYYGLANQSSLNMSFSSDMGQINLGDFNLGLSGYASKFEFRGLETSAVGPIGLRTGFFEDKYGFDIGIRYAKYQTKAQHAKHAGSNLENYPSLRLPAGYAQISIVELSFDLLYRFIKSSFIDAYAGLGFGMSMTYVDLPHVKGYEHMYYNKTIDKKDKYDGVTFRLPVGARWKISNSVHVFAESSVEALIIREDFDWDASGGENCYNIYSFNTVAGISFIL